MSVQARRGTVIAVVCAAFVGLSSLAGCGAGDAEVRGDEPSAGAPFPQTGAGTGVAGATGAGGVSGGANAPAGGAAGGVNAPVSGAGGGMTAGAAAGGAGGGMTAGAAATGGMEAAGGMGGMPGAFGGYISSGSWQGFAWTATSMNGGSIMPMNFASSYDFPLCASGNVMMGDSNVAMVGWNINQTTADGAPAETATPTLAGITVKITNNAGTELRLQIQGPNGSTDANDRWCAIIPGTGGFIPFDAFNTECWAGGNGMAYAGQPLVAVMVLVPGKAATPVAFDFCIDSMAETDESGMMASSGGGCSLGGTPGEGGGTISGSDTRVVTREGRQYVVQNNVWNGNSSAQSLSVNGVSFSVTQQGNSSGTGGPPTSFPSVFIGSNHGHASSGSGLPKQVSSIASVQTGWKWSGSNGQHNAAYDVWFSTGAGGDGGNPSGGYLMVWFQHHPDVVPLGSPSGTASIAGKSWQYWTCNGGCQNGVPVISYVPPSGSISEWSFDLNDFIKHAVGTGVIKNNWYLSNVFAGFEIWSGGNGLKTDNFCAVVK